MGNFPIVGFGGRTTIIVWLAYFIINEALFTHRFFFFVYKIIKNDVLKADFLSRIVPC